MAIVWKMQSAFGKQCSRRKSVGRREHCLPTAGWIQDASSGLARQPSSSGTSRRHLQQLGDHVAVVDGGDRAARAVEEVDVGIDAEHVVDRVVDVAGTQRTVVRLFSQSVVGSDDLTALES